MSEKQPSKIAEGAQTATTEEEHPPLANNAEDRKAASALASLDSKTESTSTGPSQNVDQEAVQNAIKNLSGAGGTAPKKAAAAGLAGAKKADEVKKPLVKVDAADVGVLMEECDFNKIKATEYLRAHDGDLGRALRAFVTPV